MKKQSTLWMVGVLVACLGPLSVLAQAQTSATTAYGQASETQPWFHAAEQYADNPLPHFHTPWCAHDEMHEQAYLNDPEYRKGYNEAQRAIEESLEQIRATRATETQKTTITQRNTKYVIPTVVHVVWGGESNPSGADSIPLEQVVSNFDVFWEDLRNVPGTPGYSDLGVDTEIEFCLATKDTAGNDFTGVLYHFDPVLSDHNRNTEANLLKDTYSYPRDKYFNIWLVANIGGNLPTGGSILGYAQFPNSTTESLDGVVCRADCWGRGNFNYIGGPGGGNREGRTGTHEIGHWIDFLHVFQSGCGSNCTTTGDRVCDTPPQQCNRFGNPGTRQNTCNSDPTPFDGLDDNRNYMDYTEDFATNRFTFDQRDRAHAVLEATNLPRRNRLWQDANLQATGSGPYKKPEAYPTCEHRIITAGGSVQFYDFSRNLPDTWQWSFPGGTPNNSTIQAPLVQYDTPGFYDVELIVTNASGESDTLLRPNFIQVLDNFIDTLPYFETFEDGTFSTELPTGWHTQHTDTSYSWSNITWQRVVLSDSKYDDATLIDRAAQMDAYSNIGALDGMISPAFNVTNRQDTVALAYKYWYAPLNASLGNGLLSAPTECNGTIPLKIFDTLKVYVSTDLGTTWEPILVKGGRSLAFDATQESNDENRQPARSEWVSDTIELNDYADFDTLQFKWEFVNRWGMDLYIDDIEVSDTIELAPVATREADLFRASVKVAPNPFSGSTDVRFSLAQPQDIRLSVLDINGRVVYRQASALAAGDQTVALPLADEAAGLYVVRIEAANTLVTRRIVKR